MTKTTVSILGAAALLAATLSGCSLLGKKSSASTDTGGGGGGGAPAMTFAGNMAEAPVYGHGSNLDAPLGCNESGYAKFDIPADEAFQMAVTIDGPEGTCASVSYLNANGGALDGMMKVLCVGENGEETLDVTGQEGGSFLQVSEQPPCKDASIKVAVE